ncbi:MAG TPA: AMP-binding protein [Kofleriaceae bacterium]|nr:AMP-binding protein [Kofleriaceae bacterium]
MSTRVAADVLDRTLPGRLAAHARTRGDRVAIREKTLGVWREQTWGHYYDQVRATARAMWELGVRPGDHVAILSDNRSEWLYADLGAQSIGARSVGIYQTNPPPDVAYILQDSGSVLLFCEDQEQLDKALEIAAETPRVARIVVFDPRGTRGTDDPRLLRWSEMLARGFELLEDEPDWLDAHLEALDPAAPSMVVYTSGTTGQPKGAMLSSRNVAELSSAFAAQMGLGEDDTILSYLPLCHVAEKVLTIFFPMATGAIVHFGESIETVQADLREVSPTVFLGVPRIWEKVASSVTVKMKNSSWLKRSLYDYFTARGQAIGARRLAGTLRVWDRLVWKVGDLTVFRPLQERLGLRDCALPISGAAPISPDLIRWYHGIGIPIYEGYGLTECGGASHFNAPGSIVIGSVGKVLPTLEHRIDDTGEILVRGPSVFCGYLNQPAATAEMVDPEGWLHTGDVGAVDDAGFLRITGRKKEIIITSGGKNLSPEKIENAVKTSPFVKEAVAIGDARKFVAALIQIEYDTVGDWATRRNLPYTSFSDLAAKPEVVALIAAEVDRANELLARVEQVRAFRLLPKELSQDDGELTATQKVRRRPVQAAFEELIESMYRRPAKEASA